VQAASPEWTTTENVGEQVMDWRATTITTPGVLATKSEGIAFERTERRRRMVMARRERAHHTPNMDEEPLNIWT